MAIFNTIDLKNTSNYIIDQIRSSATSTWKFSLDTYRDPLYKVTSVTLKLLQKLLFVAQTFFTFLLELPETANYFFKASISSLSKITELIKNISAVFKFILLPEFLKKVKKAINDRNTITTLDEQKILDAKLKDLKIIGKCCKSFKTIFNFSELISGQEIPQILKEITKPLKKILFLFSFISLTINKRSLDSTNLFLKELKLIKDAEFINQYNRLRVIIPSHKPTEELKAKIKAIKLELGQNNILLDKIKYQTNLFFLKTLDEKIKLKPDIIKSHFNIFFNPEETNFFSLLCKIEEKDNVAKVAKTIKSRLYSKINSNRCSMANSVTVLSISLLEIAQTFTLDLSPMLSSATTLASIVFLIFEINFCLDYVRTILFKAKMKKLIGDV